MSLPKASLIFSIPSLQDDTILDCRLYYPTSKQKKTSTATSAAIIAHPYAPLGGSQDDPVVSFVCLTLLKHGFVVGTFNFRGAGGSAGKTSWLAKHELADYVSFYGFMFEYLNAIDGPRSSAESSISSPTDDGTLLLGGYSYGSLIARCLPSLDVVKQIFASPAVGSAQAEIVLRARDLSKQYKEKLLLRDHSRRGRNSLRTSSGMLVGGFESEETNRRISRDSSRRSLDLEGVRRSVDRIRKRPSRRESSRNDSSNAIALGTTETPGNSPKICYLLVSPLLAPITSFLSLSSKVRLSAALAKGVEDAGEDQLTLHPSCIVFGHHDVFTSHKRLRKWAIKLKQESKARFSSFEVEAAGHFWQEEGAESGLKDALETWLAGL